MTQPSLTHYQLGTGVVAFSSTRHGGYSQGHYAAFNINNYCGDDPAAIQKNREALCHLLGIEDKRLLMPHQVHLTLKWLTSIRAFLDLNPAEGQKAKLEGTDAVMTNIPGICIGVSTADCIPLLLFDGRRRVAWRLYTPDGAARCSASPRRLSKRCRLRMAPRQPT